MRENIKPGSNEHDNDLTSIERQLDNASRQLYEVFRDRAETRPLTELLNGALEFSSSSHSPASYKLKLLLEVLPDGASLEQRQVVEEFLEEIYADAVVDGLVARLDKLAADGRSADELSPRDLRSLSRLMPGSQSFSSALERLIDQHRTISIEATVDETAGQHADVHRQVFGALANGKAAKAYGLPTLEHFEKLMEMAADYADEADNNPQSYEQFLANNPDIQEINDRADAFRDKVAAKYQRFDKAPQPYQEQYRRAKALAEAAYQREVQAPQAAIDSINTMMETAGLGRFEFPEIETPTEKDPSTDIDAEAAQEVPRSSTKRRLILFSGAVGTAAAAVLNPQAASAAEHQISQQTDDYIDGTSPVIISIGNDNAAEAMEEYITIDSSEVIEADIELMSSRSRHYKDADVIKGELVRKYGSESGHLSSADLSPIGQSFGGHRLQEDAAATMRLLSQAFEKEFGYPIGMTDSYRSLEQQQRCWDEKGSACAVPGTSNHGWGMAADIGEHGVNDFSSPQHQWLRKHAHKFGWVLPEWAREGGSKPEPWHWEYVGGLKIDTGGNHGHEKGSKDDKPERKKLSRDQIIMRALNGLEKRNDGAFRQRAQAMRFFIKRDLTPYQAAGIIGNFTVESADEDLNPAVHQIGGGPGRGLAQWGSWVPEYDRFGGDNGLVEFANQKGKPWQDFYTQLEFVMWEFNNTETIGYGKLKAADNVYQATDAILNYYERPAERHIEPRLADARKVLGAFQDEISEVDRFVGQDKGPHKDRGGNKGGKDKDRQPEPAEPKQPEQPEQPEVVDIADYIDVEPTATIEAVPVVEAVEEPTVEEMIPVVEGVADIAEPVEPAEVELEEFIEVVDIEPIESIDDLIEGSQAEEPEPTTTEEPELVAAPDEVAEVVSAVDDYLDIQDEVIETTPEASVSVEPTVPVIPSTPEAPAAPTTPGLADTPSPSEVIPVVPESPSLPTASAAPEVVPVVPDTAPVVQEIIPPVPETAPVTPPSTEAAPTTTPEVASAVDEYIDIEIPTIQPPVEQTEADKAAEERQQKEEQERKEQERQEREERKEEQREQRQEQRQENKYPISTKGYTIPVSPENYVIGTKYDGYQNISGTHTGLDIPVDFVPVFAVKEGEVVSTETLGSTGIKSIVIKHPDGMYSNYQHMSGIKVNVGDKVELGEHIGQSGNSGSAQGYSTGPHLHLTMSHVPGVVSKSQPNVKDLTDDPLAYLPSLEKINDWQQRH